MDPRVKKLWIDALRKPGAYQQGMGGLRRWTHNSGVTEHCCLGVLCELYRKETGRGEWKPLAHSLGAGRCEFVLVDADGHKRSECGFLLPEVQEWAGLDSHNPMLDPDADCGPDDDENAGTCAGMNDDGHTFEEIAKMIEAVL